jgi:pimeloyl-ACP methyl ester carboxylesterase
MSSVVTERDLNWTSADGLTLYCREFLPPTPAQGTVVCLPGLTRNSRDFADLARHLAERYRVLTPDLRGRGRSQWDPDPSHYQPAVYLQDVTLLISQRVEGRSAIVGTSLGGLLAMLLAASVPALIAGIVLNDVGPEIASEGLERIARYVGLAPPPGTWEQAARQAEANYGLALPGLTREGWLRYARASYHELPDGRVVADYDPAIGELVRSSGARESTAPDLWPLWRSLSAVPALAIRGASSDILSPATLERMRQEKPDLETLVVENRGHVPLLDEGGVRPAVDAFLARLFA